MIDLPLTSLRHLLRPSCHKRRDGQPQVIKISNVIFGFLLLTAILVLLVEGGANLFQTIQAGRKGPLQ
jgi:hypothetical protein